MFFFDFFIFCLLKQWLRFLAPDRLEIDLRNQTHGSGWLLSHKRESKTSNEIEFLKKAKHRMKKLNLSKIDQVVK